MEVVHSVDDEDRPRGAKEKELEDDSQGISKQCPLCWEKWWSVVTVNFKDDTGADNTRMDNHIPKFLSCHHTYCIVCLGRMICNQKDGIPGKYVVCPLCRKRSFIYKLEDLQTNYYIAPPNTARTVTRSQSVRLVMWCDDCHILARASCESHHLSPVGSKITSFMDSIGKEVSTIKEVCGKRQAVRMQNIEIYSWIASLLKSGLFMVSEKVEEEVKITEETNALMKQVETLVNECHASFQHNQTQDKQVKQVHTTLQKLKTISSRILELHGFVPEMKYFFEFPQLPETSTNLPKAQLIFDIDQNVSFRVLAGEDFESQKECIRSENINQTGSAGNETGKNADKTKSALEEREDKQKADCLKRQDPQRRSERLPKPHIPKRLLGIRSKTLQEGVAVNSFNESPETPKEGPPPIPPKTRSKEHINDKGNHYSTKLGEEHEVEEKLGHQSNPCTGQKQQNLILLAKAHQHELERLRRIQIHSYRPSLSHTEEAENNENHHQHQPPASQAENMTPMRQADTSCGNLSFVPGMTGTTITNDRTDISEGMGNPRIPSIHQDTPRRNQGSSGARQPRRRGQYASQSEIRLMEAQRQHRSYSGSICCPRQRSTNEGGRDT